MKKKHYEDDDGRVVADMSGIDTQPMLLPRFDRFNRSDRKENSGDSASAKKTEADIMYTGEERRALIKGAMAAALLVGGIFIAVIGIAIYLITVIR